MLIPPGQEFMGIRLMPYIPDNGVFRTCKNPMQRNGQLNHSKIAGKMPAVSAHCFQDNAPHLLCKRTYIFSRKRSQILWFPY